MQGGIFEDRLVCGLNVGRRHRLTAFHPVHGELQIPQRLGASPKTPPDARAGRIDESPLRHPPGLSDRLWSGTRLAR